MIPDSDLKALSGMFADVEPKPVVVQTPEPVEEPLTIGFPSGALITAARAGKSIHMQGFLDSIQKLGRAFKYTSGGIGMVIHDDFDDLEKMLTCDSLSMMAGKSKRTYMGHIVKRDKAEKEAFKAKTRGRLIGRKSW